MNFKFEEKVARRAFPFSIRPTISRLEFAFKRQAFNNAGLILLRIEASAGHTHSLIKAGMKWLVGRRDA